MRMDERQVINDYQRRLELGIYNPLWVVVSFWILLVRLIKINYNKIKNGINNKR